MRVMPTPASVQVMAEPGGVVTRGDHRLHVAALPAFSRQCTHRWRGSPPHTGHTVPISRPTRFFG